MQRIWYDGAVHFLYAPSPLSGRSRRSIVRSAGAVGIGGAAGATLRWAVGSLFDTTLGQWPWPTVVVNIIGCILIGLAGRTVPRESLRWDVVVTGVLGGFTTMSAFAVELNELIEAERTVLAVLYTAVSVIGGVGATALAQRVTPATRRGSAS